MYAAKFNPFLSLDCARVEGVGAQSKGRKGLNFAIWQPCPQDTADIVGLLRKKEAAKGHGFPSPLEIGDRERRLLPLYQVILQMGSEVARG